MLFYVILVTDCNYCNSLYIY